MSGNSVKKCPPLVWSGDYLPNHESNTALIRHIEAGDVSTLLYGGNANMHHIGLTSPGDLLENIIEVADENTWIIPSAGPGTEE